MRVVLVIIMIYAAITFITDLRERKMYSIPANVLGLVVCIVSQMVRGEDDLRLMIIMIVSFIVFRLMAKLKIWGEGDSDYLFMLTQIISTLSIDYGLVVFVFIELVVISLSLVLSVFIAFIETRIKKEKLTRNFKAAALPGFCVLTQIICLIGVGIYE